MRDDGRDDRSYRSRQNFHPKAPRKSSARDYDESCRSDCDYFDDEYEEECSTRQASPQEWRDASNGEKSEIKIRGSQTQRWHFSVRGVDIFFNWVPPGTFCTKTTKGLRCVKITRGFWLMEKPTTVQAFEAFAQATGYPCQLGACGYEPSEEKFKFGDKYTYKNPGFEKFHLRYPATCVDWAAANAFCVWLSEEFCNQSVNYESHRLCFRLPTEAEWEWACRGPCAKWAWSGARPKNNVKISNLSKYGNFGDRGRKDGFVALAPTASFAPNANGLYDMHGNVWEWCADWYAPYSVNSLMNPERDPSGPGSGLERVVRGGAWTSAPQLCRAEARGSAPPWRRDTQIGFRVALSYLPEKKLSLVENVVSCKRYKSVQELRECDSRCQYCWILQQKKNASTSGR